MQNNQQRYLHKIPVADTIGLPKIYKIICWLVGVCIVVTGLLLWFTPWTQTAMGRGSVDSLNPSQRTQAISALVSGQIHQWHVQEGSAVKKGDPIVTLVDVDAQLVEKLQGQLDAAKAAHQANISAMENAQNKAVIIITDGESHDEKAIESSEQANELGIFVHTLGMGLSKGGPIPIYNKYGNRTDYRKDRDGNTIVSKLNEQLLQQIASAGKGTYVRANNSKAGLSTLFAEINKMEKKEIGTMVFTEYKDRFQLFIGLALLLLLTDLILLGRKNKWSNHINFYKD